jgi:hypothetical protein
VKWKCCLPFELLNCGEFDSFDVIIDEFENGDVVDDIGNIGICDDDIGELVEDGIDDD